MQKSIRKNNFYTTQTCFRTAKNGMPYIHYKDVLRYCILRPSRPLKIFLALNLHTLKSQRNGFLSVLLYCLSPYFDDRTSNNLEKLSWNLPPPLDIHHTDEQRLLRYLLSNLCRAYIGYSKPAKDKKLHQTMHNPGRTQSCHIMSNWHTLLHASIDIPITHWQKR